MPLVINAYIVNGTTDALWNVLLSKAVRQIRDFLTMTYETI